MILILISLLVILFVVSIWFRSRIKDLAGTAVDYTVGTWYRIWPAIRKALIVGGIGWLILIMLMADIGAYANSKTAALIISILFPFWFLSMLIPRRTPPVPFFAKWKIPIFGIVRVFGGFVLLIASLSLAIGLWSPDTKGAINERFDDFKTWTANFYKKGSAHSERNAGVRGRTKSATKVFDEFNNPIEGIIPAGKIVMVLKNIQSKPATETREALLLVMLPDQHNNFVEGKKVWMPALKIEFINNEDQETSIANVKTSAASTPGKIPQLCWKKQDGHAGNGIFREYCSELTHLNIDGGKITLRAKNGNIGEQILVGNKIEDFEFKGNWTQDPRDYEGEWQLRFSPDFKTAVGWQTNKEDSKKIYTWIK